MALRLNDKQKIVADVAQIAAKSMSAVAANCLGLTVHEMTELRRAAREKQVHIQVVRNTLASRAVEGTELECLKPALKGPLVLAFSLQDLGSAAKLFRDFAKKNDKIEVKALAVSGKLLPAKDLDAVASLPTRDEALSLFMRTMNAATTQFVRTLAEPHAQFVRVLAAVGDKK